MDHQPLAAAFFLITHDEFDDGKLRINPELLGRGLAGAQLAELLLDYRLDISDDDRVLVAQPAELDGGIGDYMVQTIAQQTRPRLVRIWVDAFAEPLVEMVARDLVSSGLVTRQPGARRLGRRLPDRFPGTDLLAAARPRQQLERMLRAPQSFDLRTGILAVLIGAVGIETTTVLDPELDRRDVREVIAELEENLPRDLQALARGVRGASTADVTRVSR
jgi:hypothetical protein